MRLNAGALDAPAADAPPVSAESADWAREHLQLFEWCPSRRLLAALRDYQRWRNARVPGAVLMKKMAVMRHRFWSIVAGAEIPLDAAIGGGLLLPHPNGVVIHREARIGPNCLLFQQVTIGMRDGGVPDIGGHVDIGAGAKILGDVKIGDHARIGANAVVLGDVPAGCTAVGIPAVIIGGGRADPG